MSRRSDGVTGYVAGGLGNQLFILGAAWEQARRLSCPLYLDASHFAVPGTHRYGLDALEVGAVKLAPRDSWRAVRLNAERVLPIPTRPTRIFLERDGDRYTDAVHAVRPGTTLVGYFQSPRYFPGVYDDLLTAMDQVADSVAESDALARVRAEPAITLHLRRGDYVSVPAERQFIATVAYARRAIALLRDLGLDLPVRLFSDSPDLVRDELGGGHDQLVFADEALGTWATLKAMAAGEAIVMSNSSYSWWAAALMRRHTPDARVVGPRPWTRSGTAKADLLGADWITLDAR